jgi:hypothetical protein
MGIFLQCRLALYLVIDCLKHFNFGFAERLTGRLRVATIMRQGISGCAERTASGMHVAASPISSRLRTVAS